MKTLFIELERRAASKDRLAFLDRRYPPRTETAAIAYALNLIHHRQGGIAGTQEVAVHGMHMARGFDRLTGCRYTLTEHLATIQLAKAQVLTDPAKQILFDGFQGQQGDQLIQHLTHACSPVNASGWGRDGKDFANACRPD